MKYFLIFMMMPILVLTSCMSVPPLRDDYRNPLFIIEAQTQKSTVCFKVTYVLNATPEIKNSPDLFLKASSTAVSAELPIHLKKRAALANTSAYYHIDSDMTGYYATCNCLTFGNIGRESTYEKESLFGISSEIFHCGLPTQPNLTYRTPIHIGKQSFKVDVAPGDARIYFRITPKGKIQGVMLVWPYPNLPSVFDFEAQLTPEWKTLVQTPSPVFAECGDAVTDSE